MSHSSSLVLIYSVAYASALVYNKAFLQTIKIDFILSWIIIPTVLHLPCCHAKKMMV